MANYIVQDTSLETVADSIRAKAGISEKLVFPDGWKAAVDGIKGGGGSVKVATARFFEGSEGFKTGIEIGTGAAVTWENYYTHFLYNGVRLPRIPDNVLAQYPYAWIRDNGSSNYYDLLLSSSPWWCSTNTSSAVTISTENYTQGIQWYRVQKSAAESATAWTFNQLWNTSGGFGAESNRPCMWSNHDIPNGSATATDIYFAGSEPVPTE